MVYLIKLQAALITTLRMTWRKVGNYGGNMLKGTECAYFKVLALYLLKELRTTAKTLVREAGLWVGI